MNKIKKYLSLVFIFLIQALKRVNELLTNNASNPNPSAFDDLTPVSDADEDQVYSKALVWAIDNPELRNLALTGPYGSGKSSILKTFEHQHPEYRYLNISLASFDEISADDEADRKRIEVSILQQIFYRVSGRKMPDSRFKRIKATKSSFLLLQAFWLILCVIAGTFLFKPAFFDRISWWTKFRSQHGDLLIYLSGIVFLTGCVLIVKKLLRNYNSARFHKLNLTSGEIELAADVDASILNKHLDEILYFFEKTGYNVVALEDIDRFENPEKIFSKLRELNNIINNSSQIKHKVTFIYALKDDVFLNDERTKFFDFFIPVIPVINSSNSGELLLKKFQIANAQGQLTDNFLMNVTFFIQDMRQLKNVYNEYIIYKNKLKLNLNEEKLFSMILYKNFYPTDFAELNVNKGMIYDSFANKRFITHTRVEGLRQQINEAREKISELENIHLSNLEELKAVYLYALVKLLPDSYRFEAGGSNYNIAQLSEDNVFAELAKEHNIRTIRVNYGNWQQSGHSFKSIENTIDPKQGYLERKKQVKLKFDQQTEKLKSHISAWSNDIANLEHLTLAELIEQDSTAFSEKVEKERILLYLLRNSYIDENYQSYISHFYEGTLTRADMDFVFSVKNHTALEAGYQLNKIDQIMKKLQPGEFLQREVRNYNLLDYLAEKNVAHKKEFLAIIKQLSDQTPGSLKFIDDYLTTGKLTGVVMKAIFKQWPTIWDDLNSSSNYTEEKLNQYLKLIIQHADNADLEQLNKSGRLKTSIENMNAFLTLFANDEADAQIKKMLDKLSIEFVNLEYIESRKELFDHIYRQSNYRINENMIQTVITHYANDSSKVFDLKKSNYTSIRSSGCEPLNNYIKTNIIEYLDEVLFAIPENTVETEQFYLELLNNTDVEPEYKDALIEKIETLVSAIDSVDPSLWGTLFENKHVLPIWRNVLLRFIETDTIDDALLAYLNEPSVYQLLSVKKMSSVEADVANNEKLSLALLTESHLSDAAYGQLINSIPWTWNSLSLEKIPASKVDILLKVRKINMTISIYQALKTHHNGMNTRLIENDFTNFKKLKAQITLDEFDYRLLLSSSILTGAQKKSLVSEMDVEVINNDALGDLVTTVVYKQRMVPLSFPLLAKLVAFNVDITRKVILINQHLNSIDQDQLTLLLQALKGNYAKITERGKQPSLPGTPENWILANYLDSTDYVSSIKPVKDHIVINNWRK